MEIKKEKEWYDDPNLISNLLIGLIIIVVIISQSFAIRNRLGLGELLNSLFNSNGTYLAFLVYFILLKFKFGKKYFNYLNIILVLILVLNFIGGLFSLLQNPNIITLFTFLTNLLFLIYFGYSFIKNTHIFKSLKFDGTSFEKISNNSYFYIMMGLYLALFIVNIYNSLLFNHVVLYLLQAMVGVGMIRYVYLYNEFKNGSTKMDITRNKPKKSREKGE